MPNHATTQCKWALAIIPAIVLIGLLFAGCGGGGGQTLPYVPMDSAPAECVNGPASAARDALTPGTFPIGQVWCVQVHAQGEKKPIAKDTTVTLSSGESLNLAAVVYDKNCSDVTSAFPSDVSWSVSGADIGVLSASGSSASFTATASTSVKTGTITATLYQGDRVVKQDAIAVVVNPGPFITATLSATSLTLTDGTATATLTCTVTGGTASILEGRCDTTGAWMPMTTGDTMNCAYTGEGTYTPGCRINGALSDDVDTPVTVSAPPLNQPPVASASANVASGAAPLLVNFTGGCTDADGTCASYSWDFGDGSAANTNQNPSHTFTAAGTYTAILSVTDNSAATATNSVVITVTPTPNQPPTASTAADVTSGIAPLAVNFTGSCTDTDGTCAGYSWDFDDGSPTSSQQNPSHNYTATGTFTATLTVTDNAGATGQQTATINVVANQPPAGSISLDVATGPAPLNVNFTGSCTDSDGTCISYLWDFGDSTPTSSLQNPSHTFSSNGTFTVTLTVTDNYGATSQSIVPITVHIGVAAIEAGFEHTCALTTSSGVKCWGNNATSQLGDGTATDRLTPVDVTGLTSGVAAIAAGWGHTCALTTGSGVKCWGSNINGQLGDGTGWGDGPTPNRRTPVDVTGLTSGVAAIASGYSHTCALTTSGGVKCWGYNFNGQLGDGTTTDRLTPVDVTGMTSGVAAIEGESTHTCALTTGGGVKCWGNNTVGQLGDGTTTDRLTPVDVTGLTSGVAAIASGYYHTCALTTSGGVKCWGHNIYGQLGDGTTTSRDTPVDVTGLTSGVAAIAAGSYHTCALTTGGGVKCWGYNFYGQLGDGTNTNRLTPVYVTGMTSGVADIEGGAAHSCTLTTSSGVTCWGRNLEGQLGDGTTTERWTPVNVVGF